MRELSGYSDTYQKPTSDFMVLDSWYCYEVVYYDRMNPSGFGKPKHLAQAQRLAEAERVCSAFNAEHEAEGVAA